LKILITGATGFIGSHLVKKLSDKGHEVLALSRTIPVQSNKCVSWIAADLCYPETYRDRINDFLPEVLIHLAWGGIPDFSLNNSLNNLNSSLNLISFVAEIGSCKKILISGSCWEYSNHEGECFETDLALPNNYFTLAKNSLREWISMIAEQKSIDFGWFRLFYVYGPGQRFEALLPTIIRGIKEGKVPNIKNPYNANDYIFIEDVVVAFEQAVDQKFTSGIYNLGSGASTSAIDICRIVEKVSHESLFLSEKLEKSLLMKTSNTNFWANIAHTKKQLNWSPKISINEGVRIVWDNNSYL
jgi:nucleoside-diphosphate-sugar epimerase